MRRSSALLLAAGLLIGGGAATASASCVEEIPGVCVTDPRDECPVRPVC